MIFTRVSSRTGMLKLGEFTVKTPALAIPTTLYSIHRLTRDIFDKILDPERTIIEVYYEDIWENWDILKALPISFKQYANLEGYAVWLALREDRYFDNLEQLKHISTDDEVSCINHGGVCKMPIKAMIDINCKIAPEALICPVDHFALPATGKRLRKSVLRTAKYYDQLKSISNLVKSHVGDMQTLPNDSVLALSGITSELSNGIPQDNTAYYVRGLHDLDTALKLIKDGKLAILDASFILAQSEKGYALQITSAFDIESSTVDWIDINDKKYEADTTKLCVGCSCTGCQFMKSYIHHLFVVSEMLGPAALVAHNLHQTMQLLKRIQ